MQKLRPKPMFCSSVMLVSELQCTNWMSLLPASYRTRWNLLFSHTLGYGVGGVMLPFFQLAHRVGVPQHMGWGGDVAVLATCAHMVDVPQHMGWGGDVTVVATCTHGGCSATHGVGG